MIPHILLIRLDAIGDYVLFRNVLHFIRQSKCYHSAHLTVLGNPAWKSIAETFDRDAADEWVWLQNRNDFFRYSYENLLPEWFWHRRIHRVQSKLRNQLRECHFDEVLSLQIAHDPLLEELIENLAPRVVGVKNGAQSIYTQALDPGGAPFIFIQNRTIASNLTGENCDIPFELKLPDSPSKENAILVHLGASHWTRRWSSNHLKELCKALLSETKYRIVLAGGPMDQVRAWELAKSLHSSKVEVEAGQVSLADFIRRVAAMKLVISNDTSSLHIAAAVGTPCVAISNGYSGRGTFWPYPDTLKKNVTVLTPDNCSRVLPSFLPLSQWKQYRALVSVDANRVLETVKKVLSKDESPK